MARKLVKTEFLPPPLKKKGLGKGSSGRRFESIKYLLDLSFLVKIIKPNMLNVKGLANEDGKVMVQLIYFENIKIYLHSNLLPLEPFS